MTGTMWNTLPRPEIIYFLWGMDLSKIKPIYLILVVVIAFAIWKLPEAMQHSQANEQNQQELGNYLDEKGKALSKADSDSINSFVQTLERIFTGLDAVNATECQINSGHKKPRILDWNLLWYLFEVDPATKSKDLFFEKVSTLNSQNPIPQLNLTVGDGFTQDMGKQQWNPGTLTYIENVLQENLLFIARLEKLVAPEFTRDESFQAGVATVGVWACDLAGGKAICKHTLTVQSDDSYGMPLKVEAMNQKLRLELLEKTVEEVERFCWEWMGATG